MYITTQAMAALGGVKAGTDLPEDSYLSVGMLSSAATQQDDSYMTLDAIDGMMVDAEGKSANSIASNTLPVVENVLVRTPAALCFLLTCALRMPSSHSEGQYLTPDAANKVISDAGFNGAADTGYLTLADATALVDRLQGTDTYLSIDEMQAVAKDDDSYLTVADMQSLATAGGGAAEEDAYLTLDCVADIVAKAKAGGGKRLPKANIAAALKDQEEGYMTLAEVQNKISANIANTEGEYLSVDKMQELFSEAGYLSIADMQALNPRAPCSTAARHQMLRPAEPVDRLKR